ncbi:MAG: hypothetical protein IJE22_04325 [Oscillibacter sp.]|nr:hypothetical protein [Oscillibacter sp.]MBQ2996450.1 hypothetical protein [Oscillibacter sp.]
MEKKLRRMFDLQKFEDHERLSAIIGDVDSRYGRALSDDDLELVSAAGETAGVIHVILKQENIQ